MGFYLIDGLFAIAVRFDYVQWAKKKRGVGSERAGWR